ncbi:MAG: 50S ribosomal protein L16 [Chloroflexi bacterium]|nr:50S ribosomal protein L16 [Chloroflexota bacterium]
MQQPKRVKYRKSHRGKRRGVAVAGGKVSFGEFGLQAAECAWVTARQIEAARRVVSHRLQRGGKMWVTVFADKPISKKPLEVRMGGGKGATDQWVAVVKPGRIIFEVAEVPAAAAIAALKQAGFKLPIACRVIARQLDFAKLTEVQDEASGA